MAATQGNRFDASIILDGIRRWVEIETPTEATAEVNRLGELIAEGYADLPAHVERIAGRDGCGDHLAVRSAWGQDAPGILVLSHHDTVHPLGFIERLPFKIDGDRAFGPGIYDMKGGAYLAYHAFRQICADGVRPPLAITQLYVSDEEIGSPTSRALIEAEGRKAKYVLVTEPARDGGRVVTGRKGVGRFEVFVTGVPAHAGAKPEDGRSAIRELANVIQALDALNDPKRGITVNVGVVRGGTRPNVIAEEAYAEIDLRVRTMADADELVHARPAAENGEVADADMARQHHVVGEDDVVADLAVVPHMAVGQEGAAVADDGGHAAALGAGVHGHAFADQAVAADRQRGGLALVFQVLRLMADRGEGKDARARTDGGAADYHRMAL